MGSRHFEPRTDRLHHRLSSLYAVEHGDPTGEWPISQEMPLKLGRLERFYRASRDQAPNVLHYADYAYTDVETELADGAIEIARCRIWLFHLPYGALVAGLSLDFSADLGGTIALLEDCYYLSLKIGGSSLIEQCRERRPDLESVLRDACPASHTHQLLFLGRNAGGLLPQGEGAPIEEERQDVLQRLVYRANLPYRSEHSRMQFPAEPNRRPQSILAVSPYVSVASGQQDYIENGMLLSAAQAIGSAHLVSSIRSDAYAALDRLRGQESANLPLSTRRRRLASLSDRLSRLEVDLSFGAEAYENLGSLVPSLRLTDYHRAIFQALEIPIETTTTGKMLARLSKAIDASANSVKFAERRRDEQRRLKWSVAAGFVSIVAITLGIAFGFFGSSVSEVSPRSSIFSWAQYRGLYLFIAGVIAAGMAIFLLTWLLTWRSERNDPDEV